jgi:hypothetical protein
MEIHILGAGPRGLSVAILALSKGLSVTLIDKDPLSSWHQDNLISDIEMRSPASFDLVSFLPKYSQFSLTNYLGYDLQFSSQKEVEECNIKVKRSQFYGYIEFIFNKLLEHPSFTFVSEEVKGISQEHIFTSKDIIGYQHLVLALGNKFNDIKIPLWIKNRDLKFKLKSASEVLNSSSEVRDVLVVGSGQGAAEVAAYLQSHDYNVDWVVNKYPLINKYPLPTYKEWGMRSGLSNYYKKYLSNWNLKANYLKKIKGWQPSITPKIKEELDIYKPNRILVKSFSDLDKLKSNYDAVICLSGFYLNKEKLSNFGKVSTEIDLHPYFNNFVNISSNFKLKGKRLKGVYTTGILATGYDGPRQNSLISAGITADIIIEDVINNI